MNVQAWTFLLVAVSFALYLGIAIWSRATTTKDFYVAGTGVSPLANGMATAADWMSAASFISMAGLISFMGYDGSVYLMGWTGGYVLLALLLAPYLRKFGAYTVPDFVGDRYYSQTARIVAVLCAIFVSFTYVAGQMRGVGIVFSRFLEVDVNHGVYVGMAIVFFYAVLGGMKGITYTQVAQYCVLIFAYMVPAIFLSMMITGTPIPQLGLGGVDQATGTPLLERLNGLHEELGFAAYTAGTRSTLDVFLITAALMVGTAGLPHVIIRFYTVPRVRDARLSVGWALVFIALLYTTAPAVAVFARTNLIASVSGTPYAEMPPGITERGELIAARVSAGAAVLVAGYLGVNPPGFVAQVVAFAFGLAASSFFPVIILGIFWHRATREGAIAGMLTGITFTAAYIVYFKFMHPELNTADHWWLGISPEGIGAVGMVLNA
ncbi:MAG: sodium:solute symporter family protein, partial [Gemmatimonadota bacterium]